MTNVSLSALKADARKVAQTSAAAVMAAIQRGETPSADVLTKGYNAARIENTTLKDTAFKAAVYLDDKAAMLAESGSNPSAFLVKVNRGLKAQKAVNGLKRRAEAVGLGFGTAAPVIVRAKRKAKADNVKLATIHG